jgi:8-oxo-dGTP pyrophosphatase MutT (NUDIX family)
LITRYVSKIFEKNRTEDDHHYYNCEEDDTSQNITSNMISKIKNMVSVSSIKRVVSVFILRPKDENPSNIDVAVFRRCPTMPTFANHWAGISGSIEEDDDSPLDAAVRELQEETNVGDVLKNYFANEHNNESEQLRSCMKAGLHLDVPKRDAQAAFGGRIIRVYPFALRLPESSIWSKIEMRGTEHDEMKFIPIDEFLDLSPVVPGLQTAFHHATTGAYLNVSTRLVHLPSTHAICTIL